MTEPIPPVEGSLPPENTSVSTPKPGSSAIRGGVVTMIVGFLIAVFPALMAVLSTAPGSSMWNEGDPNSGAAALWLMFVSIPIGSLVGIIGLVILIIGLAKN